MSKALGPILATGAVTIVNRTVFHDKPMDWRVPIATGFAGIGFVMFEKAAPEFAVIVAWTAFLTIMLTRVDPGVPSPVESALQWWKKG